jgi:cytochrome c oxidase subunit 2
LEITAADVIHSFWVPNFGQKQDAVPGQVNDLTITPTRTGTFPVICTELCGLGHSTMRSTSIVMSASAFRTWYAGTAQRPQPGGGSGTAGGVIFTKNGCGACHTLTAVPGATGKVGPDLDTLSPSAKAAGQKLIPFIKQSIVDPNAYIAKGYQPGVMPGTFGTTIPHQQLNVLVAFIAAHTK